MLVSLAAHKIVYCPLQLFAYLGIITCLFNKYGYDELLVMRISISYLEIL